MACSQANKTWTEIGKLAARVCQFGKKIVSSQGHFSMVALPSGGGERSQKPL
jgi:hypothetical protein